MEEYKKIQSAHGKKSWEARKKKWGDKEQISNKMRDIVNKRWKEYYKRKAKEI